MVGCPYYLAQDTKSNVSRQTNRPYQHYVDGEWTEGSSESTFVSKNPATGETLGTFHRGTETDVSRALSAAKEAKESWSALSYIDRAEYLWDIYHELRDRTNELGEIVTKECGKEISEGKADVIEAYHMVEWAAGMARHPHGDIVPSEVGSKDASMRRKPRGIVGCITPWNFPVAIPFWHMAVALVEGNTVVWKPAEQTPWCGQIIAEMFEEAGIPDGVFNMIQGFGDAGTPSLTTSASIPCCLLVAPKLATRSPRRWAASPANLQLARWVGRITLSSRRMPISILPSTRR